MDGVLTIGEALPKEIARVQELVTLYESVPTGIFMVTIMKIDIQLAQEAIIEGNLSGMIYAYQRLQAYK